MQYSATYPNRRLRLQMRHSQPIQMGQDEHSRLIEVDVYVFIAVHRLGRQRRLTQKASRRTRSVIFIGVVFAAGVVTCRLHRTPPPQQRYQRRHCALIHRSVVLLIRIHWNYPTVLIGCVRLCVCGRGKPSWRISVDRGGDWKRGQSAG